jgi:hypothetical protein
MSDEEGLLNELLELAAKYGARHPQPESRIYTDLDINGGDFIEFVEDVERRYDVDLSWVSPHDHLAEAQDPTIRALTQDVMRQLGDGLDRPLA